MKLCWMGVLVVGLGGVVSGDEGVPRVEDYTASWWVDGFPPVVEGAPWEKVVRTGRYALVLDTEAMAVRHFGLVGDGGGYERATAAGERVWEGLPAAGLELQVRVNGETYRCVRGGEWGRFTGPRLVEAGRFFQRFDVTDLVFESAGGERLETEARFEVSAWADRLGLKLEALPAVAGMVAGEGSFGKVGGGFGLDGTNALEIPHEAAPDREVFALEFWAFVPADYRVSTRTWPWLVCKGHHEAADGNYGILLVNGVAQGRLNIGGGRDGQVVVGERKVEVGAWNHFVLSYDGAWLRLYLNGRASGSAEVGKARVPVREALVFGRRGDGHGDGYRFRGVVDEVRLYGRALGESEVRERSRGGEIELAPVRAWGFREDGRAADGPGRVRWDAPQLSVRLAAGGKVNSATGGGESAGVAIDVATLEVADDESDVRVECERPVAFDRLAGWHRINLDGIEPTLPPAGARDVGDGEPRNDAMERVRFVLKNDGAEEAVARLMFEKTARGIRHRLGSPITGVSAVLCDVDGRPTGIPVQLSKNWHHHPLGGAHSGQWFHGVTQVRVPAGATRELQVVLAYGHWGGVAAASHAQLSLVGWGSNQRWDQSALGAWGESICYEPEQAQAACVITDVRPAMVVPKSGEGRWSWTHNVGGGDFFRVFDRAGKRLGHASVRATYASQGPCLTEVRYAGRVGEAVRHSAVVSLGRTDDIVRGTFRLRMDVEQPVAFSRLVLFQVGADTYNHTREFGLAWGNVDGAVEEWAAQHGGDVVRKGPVELTGRMPWVSMHEGAPRGAGEEAGAWANRGIVVRSWQARLGGKEVATPWIVERGVTRHRQDTSTIDVVPPPEVERLEKGDFVEAVFEYLVLPQKEADYYGPNAELRGALGEWGNTWRMVHREAAGNDRRVEVPRGSLVGLYPAVRVGVDANGGAALTLRGGVGYVPVRFDGLERATGYVLRVDGEVVDQAVHGNDFWQTDYDPVKGRWSRTYTLPSAGDGSRRIELLPNP